MVGGRVLGVQLEAGTLEVLHLVLAPVAQLLADQTGERQAEEGEVLALVAWSCPPL